MESSQTRTDDSTPTPRRAVLIGIDHYPLFPEADQLQGCRNDVEMAHRTLLARGFARNEITVLTDAEAERDSILAALRQLRHFAHEASAQGATAEVFVHYSGHGSFFVDSKKDSRRTETLVPHDSSHRGDPNRDIPDTWIRDWLRWIGRSTDAVSLVFDSCYSGSLARRIFGSRHRGVGPAATPPAAAPAWWRGGWGRGIGQGSSTPNFVLASACGACESAHEIDRADPRHLAYGVFSRSFYSTLLRAPSRSRWVDVFELARVQVTAAFPAQHPQLEGDRQRPMAGLRSASGMHYVVVEECGTDHLRLDGGAVHGMLIGSTWSIHAPSITPHTNARELARVEITEVGATKATGRLVAVGDSDSIRPGCRAIEVDRPAEATDLRVHVDDPAVHTVDTDVMFGAHRELLDRLRSAPGILQADSPDVADVRLALHPEPSIPSIAWMWHATFPDGSPFGRPQSAVDSESAARLSDNLERWARYRRMLDLASRHGWAPCALRFLVERDHGWDDARRTPEDEPLFVAGERMAFEISNRGSEPLFPYLFHLGDRGDVTLLDPAPGGHEVLAPGRTRTVGDGRRRLIATWTGGLEYIQLFVGLSEIDLSSCLQTGIRGGASSRGVAIDDSRTWGTLVCSFRVDATGHTTDQV